MIVSYFMDVSVLLLFEPKHLAKVVFPDASSPKIKIFLTSHATFPFSSTDLKYS